MHARERITFDACQRSDERGHCEAGGLPVVKKLRVSGKGVVNTLSPN
jgi:hypothetical protein